MTDPQVVHAWLLAQAENTRVWVIAQAENVRAWLNEAAAVVGAYLGDAEAQTTAFLARHGLEIDGRVALPLLALVAIVLVVAVLRLSRRRPVAAQTTAAPQPLAHVIRTPAIVGYTALLVFFGGFGTFAAVAHLASAAVSPGVVSPDGSRKTIAHLEGGIVREIGVREGDVVEQGQMLVSLEDVGARAEFEALRESFVNLVTIEARLLAELEERDTIEEPASLAPYPEDTVTPAMLAQQRLLESRRATFTSREQILEQRIRQLEAEIAGLHDVIEAQDEQIALIGEEVETVETLLDRGLGNRPRLLALQREGADLRAQQASSRASIARHEQAIGETRIQLLTMTEAHRESVSQELSRVRSELATVRSQLPSREDVLARTIVTAPTGGTVVNLRISTETGVVRPGEPLLDLVPMEANLIIDAQVKPIDIDVVRAGQTARVVFTAYGQRNLPQITGQLRSISADRITDERSGEPYFLAKVEVDPIELERVAPEVEISPGMPADVMILTGERTLLDYLLRPFIRSMTRSFRES
jgi:HlyD family type I secretion membrane fusion protein